MIITPLGTVSPYCKGSKNCPGFLIYSNNQNLLLDCGSGITRLLNMPADLKNLVIIISHLHKDHYSDLSSIGYATYVYKNLGLLKDKVKVYIPKEEVFSQDYEYLMNFREENFLEFITYTHEDILNKYKYNICQIGNMDSALALDLGDYFYIAKFDTIQQMYEFRDFLAIEK